MCTPNMGFFIFFLFSLSMSGLCQQWLLLQWYSQPKLQGNRVWYVSDSFSCGMRQRHPLSPLPPLFFAEMSEQAGTLLTSHSVCSFYLHQQFRVWQVQCSILNQASWRSSQWELRLSSLQPVLSVCLPGLPLLSQLRKGWTCVARVAITNLRQNYSQVRYSCIRFTSY